MMAIIHLARNSRTKTAHHDYAQGLSEVFRFKLNGEYRNGAIT